MVTVRYHIRDAAGKMHFDRTEAQKDTIVGAGGTIVSTIKYPDPKPKTKPKPKVKASKVSPDVVKSRSLIRERDKYKRGTPEWEAAVQAIGVHSKEMEAKARGIVVPPPPDKKPPLPPPKEIVPEKPKIYPGYTPPPAITIKSTDEAKKYIHDVENYTSYLKGATTHANTEIVELQGSLDIAIGNRDKLIQDRDKYDPESFNNYLQDVDQYEKNVAANLDSLNEYKEKLGQIIETNTEQIEGIQDWVTAQPEEGLPGYTPPPPPSWDVTDPRTGEVTNFPTEIEARDYSAQVNVEIATQTEDTNMAALLGVSLEKYLSYDPRLREAQKRQLIAADSPTVLAYQERQIVKYDATKELESLGVIEEIKNPETGVMELQLIKPVGVLTDNELRLANAAGFSIVDKPKSLSEKMHVWYQEQSQAIKEGTSEKWSALPDKYKQTVLNYLDQAKSDTAVIGKVESTLFGPIKAVAKAIPGKQPFEDMTVVNMAIVDQADDLTPSQRNALAFKVGLAGFTASVMRDAPVGAVIKTALPIVGGLFRKVGRFTGLLVNPIVTKSPEALKPIAKVLTNISGYGQRFLVNHPRSLEVAAWAGALGLQANTVVTRTKRGDPINQIAGDVFIDLASMAGTDVALRLGYQTGIPIKYGKVNIPLQGGGSAQWKGFYLAYGDDVHRLTGSVSVLDDAGKLIHKTDDIGTLAQQGVRQRYVPETKIQSKVTIDAMKKLGYADDQIQLVNDVRDVIFQTQDIQSKFAKEFLPTKTGTLDERAVSRLKKFFLENVDEIHEIYGSYPTRTQLNEAYEYTLAGKSALRVPGDIDVMIRGSADDVADFTSRLVDDLKRAGARVRINAENPTLIEAYVGDGKWAHAVDIHMVGESIGATETGLAWGFKLDKGTITIEGLPTQKLGEQGIRKGSSILGFDEGFEIGPLAHRLKDIPDFIQVQQTLIDSNEWWSSAVQDKLNKVAEYYGVVNIADVMDTYDDVVKIALQFGSDATASGLNIYSYMGSLGLASYIPSLGLPSISEASRATRFSTSDISTFLNSGYSMSQIYDMSGATFSYTPVSNVDVSFYDPPSLGVYDYSGSLPMPSLSVSGYTMPEPVSEPPSMPSPVTVPDPLSPTVTPSEPSPLEPSEVPSIPSPPSPPPEPSEPEPPSPPSPPDEPELYEPPSIPSPEEPTDGEPLPSVSYPVPKTLEEYGKYLREGSPDTGRLVPRQRLELRRLKSKWEKQRRIIPSKKREPYRVIFQYATGASETERVDAHTFHEALVIAQERKKIKLPPLEVEVEKLAVRR